MPCYGQAPQPKIRPSTPILLAFRCRINLSAAEGVTISAGRPYIAIATLASVDERKLKNSSSTDEHPPSEDQGKINMTAYQAQAPWPLKLVATLFFLFGALAFLGSVFLWGEGFILQFPPGVDYRFPVTDILVNAPVSILAAIGLWQRRRYGYIASQFAAGFYTYASVEIFVGVAQGSLAASPEILAPQIVAVATALVSVFYLWSIQEQFK